MLEIKVLGSGCPNCVKLEAMVKEVITEKNIEANIEKVTDINKFADYGVMLSPALVINEKVIVQGKLPTKWTLENWFRELQ
ncbi:MAG: thioredoxin family protein [Ignavibacteriales bacterium]|nr:thioredoxin family protein [Ignavibacteriales bacterium]